MYCISKEKFKSFFRSLAHVHVRVLVLVRIGVIPRSPEVGIGLPHNFNSILIVVVVVFYSLPHLWRHVSEGWVVADH